MGRKETQARAAGLPRLLVGGELKTLSIDKHFAYLKTIESKGDEDAAFKGLAYVYRATLLRADAITEIPFTVVRGNRQWKNWPPFLADLFFALECDLCIYGAAFVHLDERKGVTNFQRLNPGVMRVEADATGRGIKYFEITVGNKTTKFQPREIIYIRLYDPAQDCQPGVSPAQVALEASQLGINANKFATSFFSNFAVPAVIFEQEGTVDAAEVDRATNAWDRMFAGVANKFRTAILGQGLKAKVIGSPTKEVAMPELMGEVRKQVAVAFGIPEDMLTSEAANYATAQAHAKSFWTYTVIPEVKRIEAAFNKQFFHTVGGYLRFETESTIVMSQDEASRADALNSLVLAGLPLQTALAVLAYHIPEGYSSEPTAIPVMTGKPKTGDYKEDLKLWEKKAAYRLKRGKEVFCTFHAPSIPWQIGVDIMEGLMEAETEEDIEKVFNDQRGVK